MAFTYERMNRCFNSKGAEEVVYRPHRGNPRRIKAIIDRQTAAAIDTGRPVQMLVVEVDNSPSTGIAAAELDTGRDRIELARIVGDDPESRDIGMIVAQDEGRIRLEVR